MQIYIKQPIMCREPHNLIDTQPYMIQGPPDDHNQREKALIKALHRHTNRDHKSRIAAATGPSGLLTAFATLRARFAAAKRPSLISASARAPVMVVKG